MHNALYDFKATDEGDIHQKCPVCNLPELDHTNKMLVSCARSLLKKGVLN